MRLLAAADLPVHRLPGPVAGDGGGVGALGPDQDQVVEAVAVEALGEVEPGLPLLPGLDAGDRLGEPLVQLLQRDAAVGRPLLPSDARGVVGGHGVRSVRGRRGEQSCRSMTACWASTAARRWSSWSCSCSMISGRSGDARAAVWSAASAGWSGHGRLPARGGGSVPYESRLGWVVGRSGRRSSVEGGRAVGPRRSASVGGRVVAGGDGAVRGCPGVVLPAVPVGFGAERIVAGDGVDGSVGDDLPDRLGPLTSPSPMLVEPARGLRRWRPRRAVVIRSAISAYRAGR